MNITFEPHTARLVFKSDSTLALDDWGKVSSRFMERLAQEIENAGPCVIGHIKGFARCPNNGFLKVSVVSTGYPADAVVSDGTTKVSDLDFTLNVLAYGHPRKTLAYLVQKTVDALAQSWSGHISVLPAASTERNPLHRHGEI